MSFLIMMLASVCIAAQVESTDLSRHLVFFERAASQSGSDPVYWIRGFELQPRLTANSLVLNPSISSSPILFRFSDGTPIRREGAAAGFTLNEFRGSAETWRRNIGIWQSVQYLAVRPGVDLEFAARRDARGVEMTATLAPGTRPDTHYLEAEPDALIATNGREASISRGFGAIQLNSASAWQMRGGQRVAVEVQFQRIAGGRLALQPGTYDNTLPLYLSARLGLQPYEVTALRLSASSRDGGVYLAGAVPSDSRCATTSGGRVIFCTDVWVARFLTSGEPVFLSRLSGAYHDQPNVFAAAPNGDLWIAGFTDSADFPASAGAVQPTNAGPVGPRPNFGAPPLGDGFVSRLDGTNGNLLYSTFYGSPDTAESITALAVSDQVLIAVNGASLALLDAALGRTVATKTLAGGYILQSSLAASGEVTYWNDSALVRLAPGLGEPRFTFGLGYKGQSAAHNLIVLPNGNTVVAWTQGDPNNPEHVTYLSEIAANGERELWRTEVAPKATGVTFVTREASGEFTLLLNTSMANVATTGDAILRGACVGNSATSVMVQRYSSIGSPLYSTYLPPEIRLLSSPVFTGPLAFSAVDASTLTMYKLDLLAPRQPTLTCVTGGASRVIAPVVAPGQIITLLGAGLGGIETEVLVNRVRAPLLYESYGQINAVVPYEGLTPGGTATIEVRRQSQAPLTWTAEVRPTAVQLFTIDASGTGQAVALNQDGTLNSEQNPARAGSIVVLWGTGIGQTTPASVTGALAPISGPNVAARALGPVSAFIASIPSDVLYAGAAPGLINGAAQFNLRVPAATPPGRWPVELVVGNARSSMRVTIWTKGAN